MKYFNFLNFPSRNWCILFRKNNLNNSNYYHTSVIIISLWNEFFEIAILKHVYFGTSCTRRRIHRQGMQWSCNKILQEQTRESPSGITRERGWWSGPAVQKTTLSCVIIDVPSLSVSLFALSYRRKCIYRHLARHYTRRNILANLIALFEFVTRKCMEWNLYELT